MGNMSNGRLLVLVLVIAVAGCITTSDGKITTDISGLKEGVEDKAPTSLSSPEEICKKNIWEDMRDKEKISPVAFKTIHVEIKKVQSIDEAMEFLESIRGYPYESWAWKYVPKNKTSYVAVGIGEVVMGEFQGRRVFENYACDEKGNIRTEVLSWKPTGSDVYFDIRVEYPYIIFYYNDTRDETINVTARVYKFETLLWENSTKESVVQWAWIPPQEGTTYLTHLEAWHESYHHIELKRYESYY